MGRYVIINLSIFDYITQFSVIIDSNHGDNLPLSRCSAESYPISQSQILRSELGVEEEPDEALYLYFCLIACGPLFLAIPECSYSTLAVLRTSFRPQEIE